MFWERFYFLRRQDFGAGFASYRTAYPSIGRALLRVVLKLGWWEIVYAE
jgi:hypothetical protein